MYIFHFSTFCTSKTEKYINILAVLGCFFLNKVFTFIYRELSILVYQLQGLMLQGTFYRMSMKDIARLYEYWTFLKLNSILAKRYTLLRQNLVQVNNNGLYVYLLENRNAKNVFEHPVTKEKIVLSYQNSHASLPTTAQEPDTMLRIEK